jgi:hypothetical protein
VASKHRNLFLIVLQAKNSKVKANLVSDEDLFSGS